MTTTIECSSCSWSAEFMDTTAKRIAAEVDACLHWADTHGGRVPTDADFGQFQCPECHTMHGLNGTVSCSECGHVPQEVRA